jgi:Lrp/AsnC family transcriptional regulator, regulator for asnA, asnC and gidA
MDKLDYLILGELLNDATLSFIEIAKRIDTSPYTVRRRYEQMKKEGKIFRSIVSIDLAKLGYQGKAFLFMTVSPNANKSKTISYLKTVKNVIVVSELIGPYEILAIAPIIDLKSIQTLVKEARKAPDILLVRTAFIDDTHFPISRNFNALLSKKSKLEPIE